MSLEDRVAGMKVKSPNFTSVPTHILLLAAGASSRMGQSKQLMNLTGEPLLITAVRTALEASPYVTVVLGSEADVHSRLLEDFPLHIVENHSWRKGMGNSLKTGLAEVRASVPPADAVLVMLCDQPKVHASHLKQLILKGEESKKGIVATGYNNAIGVPALFKKQWFDSIMDIGDDAGASKLIRQHPGETEVVAFPDAAIDLDTPQDVERFLGRSQGRE